MSTAQLASVAEPGEAVALEQADETSVLGEGVDDPRDHGRDGGQGEVADGRALPGDDDELEGEDADPEDRGGGERAPALGPAGDLGQRALLLNRAERDHRRAGRPQHAPALGVARPVEGAVGLNGVADRNGGDAERDQRQRPSRPPAGERERRGGDRERDQVQDRIRDGDADLESRAGGLLEHEVHQQRVAERGDDEAADQDVEPAAEGHPRDPQLDQESDAEQEDGVAEQVAGVDDRGEAGSVAG